jgi:uncharacterized protein YecE (DUF72 family)
MAQRKYFETFPCVEINSSFYRLPRPETAARWREAAPKDFEFSMKAWQLITHPASSPTYKRTRIDPRDRPYCGNFGFNPTIRWAWEQTFEVAEALRAFLVLFQCPASFRPTTGNIAALRRFFEKAKRGRFLMGWEPRGPWDPQLVASLCDELELVHVVDPFKTWPAASSKLGYYRLHGVSGPRHRYTEREFQQLKEFCAGQKRVYCMFNNVAMAEDARRFQKFLHATAR